MKTQLSSNKTIPILEQDREVIKSLGGILRPSILINNFTYRGDLEVDDIFKAMCSGFQSKPDICKPELFAMIGKDH